MLRFALFPLLLLPLFTQAETFFSLQVEDLTFEKGKEVPENFDARRYYSSSLRKWVTPTAPYRAPLTPRTPFFTPSVKGTTRIACQQPPCAYASATLRMQ